MATNASNKVLSQSFINNNVSKIDDTIKTDNLIKTKEKDELFNQIFKLSNEIFMETQEVQKIFIKHKTENYRRLKVRGKTSKERLAKEIKTMSNVRKNVAKLENAIINTMKNMNKERQNKIKITSRKIVSLTESTSAKLRRVAFKVIKRGGLIAAAQTLLGPTLISSLSSLLGAGATSAIPASVKDSIKTLVTDPLWFVATGEMITEGIIQGASELTNPDWQNWRMEQIKKALPRTKKILQMKTGGRGRVNK